MIVGCIIIIFFKKQTQLHCEITVVRYSIAHHLSFEFLYYFGESNLSRIMHSMINDEINKVPNQEIGMKTYFVY